MHQERKSIIAILTISISEKKKKINHLTNIFVVNFIRMFTPAYIQSFLILNILEVTPGFLVLKSGFHNQETEKHIESFIFGAI